MQVYHGVSAAPGLVIGPIYQVKHASPGLNRIVEQPVREQALFDAAVVLAKDELRQLEEKAAPGEGEIFLFQRAMLDDPSLNREICEYIAAGAGCAASVERAAQLYSQRIEAVDDDYISQRGADIMDACRRVVNILDGSPGNPIELKVPSILVGERVYPSDIVSLGRGLVLGILAGDGNPQSHACIIARTMGIPTLTQAGHGILEEPTGTICLLDADSGYALMRPDEQSQVAALGRILSADLKRKELAVHKNEPCITLDGTTVPLLANCSTPEDIETAFECGAEGIGLLRSELMILNGRIPSEEEQYYFYTSCLHAAQGRQVTVRTFDIGSDKTVEGISKHELNPALGVRGVRLFLSHSQIFFDQLCALLRASAKGPLRIIFPMITTPDDWYIAMDLVQRAKRQLRQRGLSFDEGIAIGCMIEVPSAVLLSPELAAAGCDFFAIGTNDLTQYTYAADRLNGQLSCYFNGPNLALHRLMDIVLKTTHEADIPVCVCGVSASEPERAVEYVRQGVRTLSMEASGILPVKMRLRKEDLTAPLCSPEP